MTAKKLMLLAAAIAGLSGVILAAAGSHLVTGLDEFDHYKSWQAANSMHLLHAVVLLFLSSRYVQPDGRLITFAATAFVLGIVLFSGSVYLSLALSLTNMTKIAPLGGLLLMLGWLLIGAHAVGRRGR